MRSYKGIEQRRKKIQNMLNKRDKLGMLEALIYEHERAGSPHSEELKDLKRRANELRNQLAVASTLITKV